MAKLVLTERQVGFLQLLGQSALRERFYLSGGTALAGFYLRHRFSEDLDFFSEKEFEISAITVWLAGAKETLGFVSVDSQQSFNRHLFFLQYADEVVKTEFTYYPFGRIEQGPSEYGVTVDSLIDIAVNKLFTIHQRPRARDYIDLFCILQEQDWTIGELVAKARAKFDWQVDLVQLGTQFRRADQAKDYPRMLVPIEPKSWQEFFINEAAKLKPDILS